MARFLFTLLTKFIYKVTLYFLGCGKTMLMDMFYENVELQNKQRIHFNAFMIDVHNRKSAGLLHRNA